MRMLMALVAAMTVSSTSLLAVPSAFAANANSSVERMPWHLTVVPEPEASVPGDVMFYDRMVFKRSRVLMDQGNKQGFEPAPFTLTPNGNGWSLTVQQASKKLGARVWSAEIVGSAMSGLMVWTREDGTISRYRFNGQQLL